MEEKDYALISDRELAQWLLIGDGEIVRYLFFDKCSPNVQLYTASVLSLSTR